MPTAAWPPWPTRARGPSAVRTRWPRSSRPGWSSCAGRTRAGDHAPSAPNSPKTASLRCPDARPSIAPWFVTTCSSPPHASAPALTTSDGSGLAPWSCGRWTSSAASILPTAPRSKSSPVSMTTHGSASALGWLPGRQPDRCARPSSGRCAPMACPTRSSPTMARSSLLASAKGPDRCSSTGSAPTTGSAICSPPRIRRPRQARSRDSTRPCARTSWSTTTGCIRASRRSSAPSTSG